MPEYLPKFVRRHGRGFRAVITRPTGGRHYSRVFPTANDAATYAREFLATPLSATTTLVDAVNSLLAHLTTLGRAPDTFRWYRDQIRALYRRWPEATFLHAITPKEIEGFIAHRRESGVSDTTIRWNLTALHRITAYAVKTKKLVQDPFTVVTKPRMTPAKRDVFHPSEVADIVRKAMDLGETDASHLVAIAFYTGMRRSELGRMLVSDVDLLNGCIHVRGKVRPRDLPIAPDALPHLKAVLSGKTPSTHVFRSPRIVSMLIERLQGRLDEPRLHCHALRHSFATALARQSTDPYVLRDLMGHKSLGMTLIYYHAFGDRARSAVAGLQLSLPQSLEPDPQRR